MSRNYSFSDWLLPRSKVPKMVDRVGIEPTCACGIIGVFLFAQGGGDEPVSFVLIPFKNVPLPIWLPVQS